MPSFVKRANITCQTVHNTSLFGSFTPKLNEATRRVFIKSQGDDKKYYVCIFFI
ncbi:hypothetical protein HanIR_Chr17g0900441 [Helianthus annuus]|nr:hypothetical protein HanIR_Chr17g0900441 [Helianthus annuus]